MKKLKAILLFVFVVSNIAYSQTPDPQTEEHVWPDSMEFTIPGTGIVAVKNDVIQVGGYIDTLGSTIIDLRMPNDQFNTNHFHTIEDNDEKAGYQLNKNRMIHFGGLHLVDVDTATINSGFLFDPVPGGNHRSLIVIPTQNDTLLGVGNFLSGQELIIENRSDNNLLLAAQTLGGFFRCDSDLGYMLPPNTNATVRKAATSQEIGFDVSIIAGSGYSLTRQGLQYFSKRARINNPLSDYPVADFPNLQQCERGVIEFDDLPGGITLRSVKDCGDGYQGYIRNLSETETITLTANDPLGTGIKFAPGNDYIIQPGTEVQYHIRDSTNNYAFIVGGQIGTTPTVLRPNEGNIGVFPNGLAVLNTGTFCENQLFMGVAATGGSVIHSIENCGDGFIGILQNNSQIDNILLPANSLNGTGVNWAPGPDYIIEPGRAVMYRINDFTGYAHIISN